MHIVYFFVQLSSLCQHCAHPVRIPFFVAVSVLVIRHQFDVAYLEVHVHLRPHDPSLGVAVQARTDEVQLNHVAEVALVFGRHRQVEQPCEQRIALGMVHVGLDERVLVSHQVPHYPFLRSLGRHRRTGLAHPLDFRRRLFVDVDVIGGGEVAQGFRVGHVQALHQRVDRCPRPTAVTETGGDVLARIDLEVTELRAVVERAQACVLHAGLVELHAEVFHHVEYVRRVSDLLLYFGFDF